MAAGIAVLVLALEGGRTLLTQTVDSVEEEVVLEPDEPGYVEFVAATPTLLSLHTHNGSLAGVSLMALTGIDAGGGVVLLPADLLIVPEGGSPESGQKLSDTYAAGGLEAVLPVAEDLFGLGFDDVVEVPTEWLAYSMGPAAPLPYLLVDDLVTAGPDGVHTVLYESGRLDLGAADAAAVYAHRNPDEPDGNRVQRQLTLWESWLGVIGRAQDAEAVNPPADSPLESFVRVLGAGTTVVEVVPFESFTPDPGAAPVPLLGPASRSWLKTEALELVPWPRQPESFLRPRVQMLDGTGDPSIRDALATEVVAAGGVVTVIGNAAAFGVEATHFAYHREDLVNDPITNSIAIQLGVDMALVELAEGADDVVDIDITVTVGLDQAAR